MCAEEAPNKKKICIKRAASVTEAIQARKKGELNVFGLPNGKAFLQFLKECLPTYGTGNAIVVYTHPQDNTVFAIGKPEDWGHKEIETVSERLGNTTVFGQCLTLKNLKK
jgi:hypothetical protein